MLYNDAEDKPCIVVQLAQRKISFFSVPDVKKKSCICFCSLNIPGGKHQTHFDEMQYNVCCNFHKMSMIDV